MTSSTDPEPSYDAIVVGGSAAGLSAAMMLGRAGRRTLVVDSALPRNRYAEHMHGVLGHDGLAPSELVRIGQEELSRYGVEFLEGEVDRVQDTQDGLVLDVSGSQYSARSLIIATGLVDELPAIPGLAQRGGRDVLHCPYCHGWEVRGQRLGVVATSPASVHQVQMVRQWTDRVTFFFAAAEPLDEATVRRLRSRDIEIARDAVTEIVVEEDRVVGVKTADGAVREVDAVFTAAPTRPRDEFVRELGLERTSQAGSDVTLIEVDAAGKTSHDRVWAAGNVVNPMANVPIAMGAGALTGSAVNGWLVADDFDSALHEQVVDA